MALKTILEEVTLTSMINTEFNIYCLIIAPMSFSLTVGETYRVQWGDTVHDCTAMDGSSLIPGSAFIGNATPFGLSGNNEPFCIGGPAVNGACIMFCLTDTERTEHTVAIYQEESGTGEDTSTGIIVKDRDGNDVIHKGAYGIRARTMDGGTKVFVDADTLAKPVETSVELDFSSGDMEVLPGSGEVFSEVNIPKPVNLIPENIAEGVDIAGIIGAFAGGSSVKIATGTIKPSASTLITTTAHKLDVIPDVILVYRETNSSPGTSSTMFLLGLGDDFAAKHSITIKRVAAYISSNSRKCDTDAESITLEDASNSYHFINSTTTRAFKVKLMESNLNGSYRWFAIAGLT